MKEFPWPILWVIAAVVAIAVAVLVWRQSGEDPTTPATGETPAGIAPPAETATPAPILPAPPVEPAEPAEPLPPLDDSDGGLRDSAIALLGQEPVASYLAPSDIVRKIVVTVDNLPRDKISMRLRAIGDMPGRFTVSGQVEAPVLDGANFARYEPFAALVDAVDTGQAVAVYRRLYPLLQQAYEELGYPGRAFHSRVIECLDDMLAAPEVGAGTRLVRPKVLYEYADPDLEARSAGQKMLMRMGPENARRVKAKLAEIRAELVRQSGAGWPAHTP